MADPKPLDPLDPFSSIDLDIAGYADGVKQWAIGNRGVIQPIKAFFNDMIVGIEAGASGGSASDHAGPAIADRVAGGGTSRGHPDLLSADRTGTA